MQKAKEAASNVAASAKAGLDKTKAVVHEKVDKAKAHDPIEKDMARQRKEERITKAEILKQQTRELNTPDTGHNISVPGKGGAFTHSGAGTHAHPTRTHHMPGNGTGHVVEESMGSHLLGKATGSHAHPTGMHHMPRQGTGHAVESISSHLLGKATGTGGMNTGTHPTGHGTGGTCK